MGGGEGSSLYPSPMAPDRDNYWKRIYGFFFSIIKFTACAQSKHEEVKDVRLTSGCLC